MLIERAIINKKFCKRWVDDVEVKKIKTIRDKVLIENFLGKVFVLINYFLVRKMVYKTGAQFIPNFPMDADKYTVIITWIGFSFIVLISIFQIITRNKIYTIDNTLSEESVIYYKYKQFERINKVVITTIFYIIIYHIFFAITMDGIDIKKAILWWVIVLNVLILMSLCWINIKDFIKMETINGSLEELIEDFEKENFNNIHEKVKQSASDTEIRSFDFEITYKAIEELLYVAECVAEREAKSQICKNELITNVSHDLKTPLTSIINYVDFLKNKTLTDEERQYYIKILETKASRINVLVKDLKESIGASDTKIRLDMKEVNIKDILNQALLEAKERIEESNLSFELTIVEGNEGLKDSLVDYNKTLRVFQNLISNILKYSKRDSKVNIKLEQQESMEFSKGYYTKVNFKNICDEEIELTGEELMERFRRGDLSRHKEGSGLGLNIAKTLVNIQGGELKITINKDIFIVDVII